MTGMIGSIKFDGFLTYCKFAFINMGLKSLLSEFALCVQVYLTDFVATLRFFQPLKNSLIDPR